MATTNICQNDLHIIYADLVMAFTNYLFWRFHRLAKNNHEYMCMWSGSWTWTWGLTIWSLNLMIINTFEQHIKTNWKLMVIILLHERFILLSYMKSINKQWLLLLNWLLNCILVFPWRTFGCIKGGVLSVLVTIGLS